MILGPKLEPNGIHFEMFVLLKVSSYVQCVLSMILRAFGTLSEPRKVSSRLDGNQKITFLLKSLWVSILNRFGDDFGKIWGAFGERFSLSLGVVLRWS